MRGDMSTTLILGGARSGKTTLALGRAEAWPGRPVMIATAEALDDEMAERIARHRAERGSQWRTIEAPLTLVEAIEGLAAAEIAVVDCLTLWLSNLMHAERDPEVETRRLIAALTGREAILVANEVGLGIVPETPLGRRFRDAAGRMNQAIAAAADRVWFVAAGLPLVLKGG